MPNDFAIWPSRRGFLGSLGALGAVSLLGPRPGHAETAAIDTASADSCALEMVFDDDFESPLSSCTLIPQETAGPYPLSAILSNSAMVRRDITEAKAGLPLLLRLKLVNINADCAPISNAAVYLWHCDKDGVYSGYSQPGANTVGQTFCRGIQVTDCHGIVNFVSIFPGWYSGRITHLHFQAFLNANTGNAATATSQIAFPAEIVTAAYNSPLYAARGQNTSVTSFAQDNVFSDGTSLQIPTMSGDAIDGYTALLTVGVAA